MKKLKILLIVGIPLLIATIFIVKIYNKPHISVAKTEAKFTLSSQKLINDFLKDEETANKKYVNKIIQVSGIISEMDATSITIKGKNSESTIQCNFLPNENILNKNLKLGQKVEIKGLCTGYLLDVVLIECVLIH